MKRKDKGFTLVEILVVILIIGLLFVFLVPKISSSTDKAREVGLKTDFHSFETAFEQLMKEKSGLGGNAGVSTTTVVASVNEFLDPALQIASGTADATGTLLSNKKDPWNNKYHFAYVSGGATTNDGYIAIISSGKDSTLKYGTNAGEAGTTLAPIGVGASNTELQAITGRSESDNAAKFQAAIKNTVEGSTKDGHDYVLACAYISGVEYTGTAGFSTDIKAD